MSAETIDVLAYHDALIAQHKALSADAYHAQELPKAEAVRAAVADSDAHQVWLANRLLIESKTYTARASNFDGETFEDMLMQETLLTFARILADFSKDALSNRIGGAA